MKRKGIAYIVLAFAVFTLVSGCCSPPKISSVSVNLIPQHRDWWCWAACTEMISDYYGHRVDQCDSANYVHGTPPDCCTGCTGNCPCWGGAWGASIGDIQNNWTHWGFNYTYVASSLPWEDSEGFDVKDTISTSQACAKSPIYVVWWWAGGGGHVVVAYGYAETTVGNFVSYKDPWEPDCEKAQQQCTPKSGGGDYVTTYAAFVNDGVHSWGNSFHRFEYTGP